MKKPLVSVVMPCYNASSTVASAIMSIKTQTYENWELIIVDDGSDDSEQLREIVLRFNDPRIKLIPTDHGGVVHAQMVGHENAEGELQTVQAADDMSLPNRLEKGVEHFAEHDSDVFVHGMYVDTYNAHHRAMRRIYRPPFKGVVHTRMMGYLASKGELLAVQDADDASMPDRLEKAVRYFETHRHVDVYCHSLLVSVMDPVSNILMRAHRHSKKVLKKALLSEQGIVGVPIFKRKVINRCPLREETKDAYDWMMHLDWMYSGFRYGFEDIALYEYVRREGSLSERNEREGKRAKALKKIERIMKEEYDVEFKPKG